MSSMHNSILKPMVTKLPASNLRSADTLLRGDPVTEECEEDNIVFPNISSLSGEDLGARPLTAALFSIMEYILVVISLVLVIAFTLTIGEDSVPNEAVSKQ